jgi:hypothetical protein
MKDPHQLDLEDAIAAAGKAEADFKASLRRKAPPVGEPLKGYARLAGGRGERKETGDARRSDSARETAPELSERSEYVPWRALSLLDKLHREQRIDDDMRQAGKDLAEAYWEAKGGRSEGVVSLDGGPRATDMTKADRAGKRLTGVKIAPDGKVIGEIKRGHNSRSRFDELILVACGGWREDGRGKFLNEQHAKWLTATVVDTEDMPTLKAMAQAMGPYYAKEAKQAPPFALGHLHVWLGRIARYRGYCK